MITSTVDGHVATVTLSRPEKLNAFLPEHLEELGRQLRELSIDAAVRVVVLTGAGRAFCAGGDVSVLRTGGIAPEQSDAAITALVRDGAQRVVETLRGLPQVTIAAVNGACAGGGLALACAADLRIASTTASFTSAFARVGQPGDMGLSWLLVRLVGSARAAQLMLLSDVIDGELAAAIGLVHEAVPADELAARVAELAGRLASYAPLALQAMKVDLHDAERLDLARYLTVEAERYVTNARSADSREAASAFMEKRTPQFAGR